MAFYDSGKINLLSESELAACAERIILGGMENPHICAGTEEDALYYGICLENRGFFVDVDVLPKDHPLAIKSGLHYTVSFGPFEGNKHA